MIKFVQAAVVLGCAALAIVVAAQNLRQTLDSDQQRAAEQQRRAHAEEVARKR